MHKMVPVILLLMMLLEGESAVHMEKYWNELIPLSRALHYFKLLYTLQ